MLRVTSMEILKLTNGWDPARDMKSVLIVIKDFLSKSARYVFTMITNDNGFIKN